MTNKDKKINAKWSGFSGALILLAILGVSLIGGTFAKYVYSNFGDNTIAAKNFYFTSNFLGENRTEYVLNSNVNEITFSLGNNIDALRCAENDISFKVEVTYNGELSGGDEPVLSKTAGTLAGNSVSTDSITLSNLKKDVIYTVTAEGRTGTGTSGYRLVLSASFKLADEGKNLYKYLDTSNDHFVLLTVWTENLTGDVTVSYRETGLIPDNTDPILKDVSNYANDTDTYNGFEFIDGTSFDATYSSHTYRFFIDEHKLITIEQFTVTLQNGSTHTASPKNPA